MHVWIAFIFYFIFFQSSPETLLEKVAGAFESNDKAALVECISPKIGDENRQYAADVILMGYQINPVLTKGQEMYGAQEFDEALGMLGTMLRMMSRPIPFWEVAAIGELKQEGDNASLTAILDTDDGSKLTITLSFERIDGSWYMLPIMPASDLKPFTMLVKDAVSNLDTAIQSEDLDKVEKVASEIAKGFM